MGGMTDPFLRKNQTGEPARSGGEFGTHKRPEGVSLIAIGTAAHAALGQAAFAGDTDAMERTNQAATTNMWDDPSFLLGHLDDLRTEMADRRYEGRDQPDVMQTLITQRADVIRRLQAAGVEVPRP